VRALGSSVHAQTDVLLPNRRGIVAVVEGGRHGVEVTVSDGGLALGQLAEHGLEWTPQAIKAARRAAQQWELRLEEGVLRTQACPPSDISWAIAQLANGAREVAERALEAARKHRAARFRETVRLQLELIFAAGSITRNAVVHGASSSRHRFDYIVALGDHHRVALDAPVPEGSAISRAVLRHLDVHAAAVSGLRQAIIYDEADRWPSSLLAQLELAQVPLIRAATMQDRLRELTD
jgi:hypothetical protein